MIFLLAKKCKANKEVCTGYLLKDLSFIYIYSIGMAILFNGQWPWVEIILNTANIQKV